MSGKLGLSAAGRKLLNGLRVARTPEELAAAGLPAELLTAMQAHGLQVMSIGFLAEMMTAVHGREEDTYSVAERLGGEAAWRQSEDRNVARVREDSDFKASVSSPSSTAPHRKSDPASS